MKCWDIAELQLFSENTCTTALALATSQLLYSGGAASSVANAIDGAVATHVAVATIEKGGTLTQEETMAVLMAAGGLPGKGGGGTGGGGKGGKGKGGDAVGNPRRRGGRGGR